MKTRRKLPEGWQLTTLRRVVREAQTGFACGERDPKGAIQLRMNNVDTRGNLVLDEFIRVPASQDKIAEYRLVPGDVLFNNTNSVALVGKSTLFQGYGEPVVFSNHFTRLRVVRERLDPSFLLLWLVRQWQTKLFENICNRWIGQSAVKRNKLLALKMPLPPLEEQKRIVTVLNQKMSAIERARAAAEAQLEAARALPAAYLRAVFSGPEAERWRVKRLAEVCCNITDGTHYTPTYVESGVPFLSVKDIRETGISFDDCRFITEEEHKTLCQRCKPERGDVLYTKVGTTGIAKAIDVDQEFSIFVSVALLKLGAEVLPEYMEKVLNSPHCRVQAEHFTQGMANQNLVIRDIERIRIRVPSIPEQRRIVTVLTEQLSIAHRTIATLQEQLDGIDKMAAAYLRQAFSGEL